MSRIHYLASAKRKAKEDSLPIYSYLKTLTYSPARVPDQMNNWLMDYVEGTNHFNGVHELWTRTKRWMESELKDSYGRMG